MDGRCGVLTVSSLFAALCCVKGLLCHCFGYSSIFQQDMTLLEEEEGRKERTEIKKRKSKEGKERQANQNPTRRASLLSSWSMSATSARRGVKEKRKRNRREGRETNTSDPWMEAESQRKMMWWPMCVQPWTRTLSNKRSECVSGTALQNIRAIDWRGRKKGDTACQTENSEREEAN